MNLGDKINELRKKNGMTQEMLADCLHVSSQAVSKWERGVANPDLELIPVLAELFKVSSDELLGLSTGEREENNNYNKELEQRLEYIESVLRVMMVGDESEAIALSLKKSKAIASFDFTAMSDAQKKDWKIINSELLNNKGSISFRSIPIKEVIGTCIDPQLINDKIDLDLDGVNRLYVRLNTVSNDPVAEFQVFFRTSEDPVWNERKSQKSVYSTNSTAEITVDFSNMLAGSMFNGFNASNMMLPIEVRKMIDLSHHSWRGTLTGLRIDTTNRAAEVCTVEEIALIDKNGEVKYSYNFVENNDLDASDWNLINATRLDYGKGLSYRVGVVERTRDGYDPQFINDKIRLDVSKAKYIHIRMRTDLENAQKTNTYSVKDRVYNAFLKIYFKTETSEKYNEQKHVQAYYCADSGMADIYVDMSKNGFWNGILTGLRIDPIEQYYGVARFNIELVEILESASSISGNSLFKSLEQKMEVLEGRLDGIEGCVYDMEDRLSDLE